MSNLYIPLKWVSQINRTDLPETTAPHQTFKYVDIGAVDSTGSIAIPNEPVPFSALPSRARRLAPEGAVVISTVRTYLRAIAAVPEDNLVFSTGFAVLEATPRADPRYLYYACRSDDFVENVVSRSTGVSYPAINPSALGQIRVAIPSEDEQRRIAAFLDDQVARIDKVIALRERQMQTARERRWELFASRVREVPSRTLPLRRVLSFVTDGPFGSAFSSDDYVEDGYPVVRLGNIGFAQFRDTDLAKIPKGILDRFRRCRVFAGDLLVAALGDGRNHAGRACTAPPSIVPAMVKGKCFCVRTVPNLASSRALVTLLWVPDRRV